MASSFVRSVQGMIAEHLAESRRDGELTPAEEQYERLRIQFHVGRILFERAIAAQPRDATMEEIATPVNMLPKLARQAAALVKLRAKIRDEWPGKGP